MSLKKNAVPFLLFCFLTQFAAAQFSGNTTYKGEYIYGSVWKHNKHLENLVNGPVTGAEFAVEWQSVKGWHRHFNYPYLGLAASWLNLGNPDTLGAAIAVYPYINFPIVRHGRFSVNFKTGVGLSYVTKTFGEFKDDVINGTLKLDNSNAAIGSHMNVYFAAGLNAEFPVTDHFSFTADYGWNHTSNGMIRVPNSGINMFNAFIGLKYTPIYSSRRNEYLQYYYAPNIPRDIAVELTASGGFRQLYYLDDRTFPIGSLQAGVYKPLTNFYRMGLGADFFYDGVFESGLRYKRTYISSDKFLKKIRFGVSWQNELIMGRLTAGIHAGIYLYNPIKNLEPYNEAKAGTLNKGLIYPYKIDDEDGWFYTRLSGKYLLTKHLYASLGLKTHLQKAEFIEWGMGYRF